MKVKKIHTEIRYRAALARFLEICNAPEGSPEAEELTYLKQFMEEYESTTCLKEKDNGKSKGFLKKIIKYFSHN